MKRVERSPQSLKYAFDHRHAPVLEVELGESFTVETEDAASGSYRCPEDAAHLLDAWYLNFSPPMANPVTGPIYVRGAEPGDTLVVHIEHLALDSQGATYWRPGHRPLGDSLRWGELGKPTLVIGRVEKEEVVRSPKGCRRTRPSSKVTASSKASLSELGGSGTGAVTRKRPRFQPPPHHT